MPAAASSNDNSRMPRPLFSRLVSVPASQNAAPLARQQRRRRRVGSETADPLRAICRDAQMFTLPAPAPIRPPFGMKVAPLCSASFTCAAVRLGWPCSSSATPPLTIGAAMLVPLSCMYAFVAAAGHVEERIHCATGYEPGASSEMILLPGAASPA